MLYLYIGLGVAFVGYVGLLTLKIVKNKKRKKMEDQIQETKVKENLDVVDDVRYTMETNTVTPDGDVNLTYGQKDVILSVNTPVTVSKDGELKPGKYIMLSSDENQQTFNMRVGIYVREYRHNQEIVLAEGDTVCAVSCRVILR